MTDTQGNHGEHDELPLEEMAVMQEPPIDLEDTSPTGVYRRQEAAPKTNPRNTDRIKTPGGTAQWLNWLLSGVAMLITLLAGILYLQESNSPHSTDSAGAITTAGVQVTGAVTINPPTVAPTVQPSTVSNDSGPAPVDVIAELLMQNGITAPPADHIFRQQMAYTIAPVRPRSGIEEYVIQPGDTLDKIAQTFGINKDTIAWANDMTFVNLLQPGDKLVILPENGVLHKINKDETIQAIAAQFKVSPFAIIDSEYNHLQNADPSTLLPAGISIIVPGGTTDQKLLYWNPPLQTKDNKTGKVSNYHYVASGTGVGSNDQGQVSFGGGPGACGFEPNNGGGPLRVPLGAGYTVVRGFFPGHSGIDLAAPTGTTVFAAANGTVIFAGWSNWGYGNSIVLAHGNIFTLYGHLSRINVSCGQAVSGGQPIGAVGSTGNATGPHLHFEIRPGGVPVNPTQYLYF